ncbi:MAG: hypothetical protein Q4G50_01240 [Corynebacterium sp.]|uniref:hypothetical protein n=1 Tax=Corynebacterium sp. TaxID=1720 RepID=UPI0026DF64E7|nr:hypothetical protein [Corynebacterium sp.]MDO5668605.1 hypothetical protein [Corynebacterium sp.]
MTRFLLASAVLALATASLVACIDDPEPSTPATTEQTVTETPAESAAADSQEYPEILEAKVTPAGDEFRVVVTVSSPYDTPERYADGWRVLTPDGDVLAEHVLHHDHQNQQPFTRSRGPFAIPEDVDEVVIEGRDQLNGYGGGTVTVPVPRQD